MSDFAETLSRHRRLTILRYLEEAPDYAANSSILTDVARGVGVASTHDQVLSDLAWLKEQGLVILEDQGFLYIATVTPRGVEVATGAALHPGIQRPRPRTGR